MKISSDTISASDAISKIVDVSHQSLTNENANLSFSTVSSMECLTVVANQLIGDISKLVACVYTQTEKVQQLAVKKSQDDEADQSMFKQ
jgi:uncharacterized protein with PIN domain